MDIVKIKNFDKLAVDGTRTKALQIAEAGLQAIDTERVINSNVSLEGNILKVKGEAFDLDEGKVFLIGIGKCSLYAAAAMQKILPNRISGGVVVDVREGKLDGIETYMGTHPLPSSQNEVAAQRIVDTISSLHENDLVIFLISGGGSTLLYLPEDKGAKEEEPIMQTLINVGATIEEINTIRKHMSLARGGYLAKYIYPAHGVALIFSDVPKDDVSFIASGPTVKDTTTIKDALEVLAKYDVLKTCGMEKCGLIETPKDDKYFLNMANILVVSNSTALEAMRKEAERMGFRTEVSTTSLSGEAKDVAKLLVERIQAAPANTAYLYGGETTVTVKHDGKGGRNLELALSALRMIKDGQIILPFDSDGHDNTDYAGALCDTIASKKAKDLGIDLEQYLSENRSYEFWEKIGDYLMTGDTGSNVSDLIITINEEKK
jgi:glycerate-2-kinase